jgi:hypothetical protein
MSSKKLRYADIVKKGNESINIQTTTEEHVTDRKYDKSDLTKKPSYITRRNNSYDSWKLRYIDELICISDIFEEGIKKIDIEYINSEEFIEKFSKFIYDNSSTQL